MLLPLLSQHKVNYSGTGRFALKSQCANLAFVFHAIHVNNIQASVLVYSWDPGRICLQFSEGATKSISAQFLWSLRKGGPCPTSVFLSLSVIPIPFSLSVSLSPSLFLYCLLPVSSLPFPSFSFPFS